VGDSPSSPHMARYRGRVGDDPADMRLVSPVFDRNAPPLLVALAPSLSGMSGPVVEIGSGTGQHAAAFRLGFPALDWIATDPDAAHRASCDAWAAHLGLPPRPALALDASRDWAAEAGIRALGALSAVVSMNVIHIAPIAVARGIVAGAGKALGPRGLLVFYGPFREGGRNTGEGNRRFDEGLRAENPDWGLRDVDEVTDMARAAGLSPAALIAMPANNRLLIFRRESSAASPPASPEAR
jgi:SAM-dependent methyltransferase